jgi:heme/copper-type cytochrome/quinol oxidase subunit 2
MKSIKNSIALSALVILLLPNARLNAMQAAPVPASSHKQTMMVLTIGFIAIWGIMVANAVYNLIEHRKEEKRSTRLRPSGG